MTKITPHIIGITGGIGSGKSTVCQLFKGLGVPCIDADQVAREIHQDPLHRATKAIIDAFPEVRAANGAVSKGALRELISHSQDANNLLKQILKPFVMSDIHAWARTQQSPYILIESALIIEEGIPCEFLIAVDAAEEVRVARVKERNPDWTSEQIQRILDLQLPRRMYCMCASAIIENNGEQSDLLLQVKGLHSKILKEFI